MHGLARPPIESLLSCALCECLLAGSADRIHLAIACSAVPGIDEKTSVLECLGTFIDQPLTITNRRTSLHAIARHECARELANRNALEVGPEIGTAGRHFRRQLSIGQRCQPVNLFLQLGCVRSVLVSVPEQRHVHTSPLRPEVGSARSSESLAQLLHCPAIESESIPEPNSPSAMT